MKIKLNTVQLLNFWTAIIRPQNSHIKQPLLQQKGSLYLLLNLANRGSVRRQARACCGRSEEALMGVPHPLPQSYPGMSHFGNSPSEILICKTIPGEFISICNFYF